MAKPILCLDFDGVLHSYRSGWKGATIIPDPPVPGAELFVREASEYFSVQVYSSRSATPDGRLAMRQWTEQHMPSVASLIIFPSEKPPAFVGLDDRVLLFQGVWPNVQELTNFRTWNEKAV